MPYLNPWLASRGLSIAEIAIIASVPPLVRIVAGPVIGFLADRRQAHRTYLVRLSWFRPRPGSRVGASLDILEFLVAQMLIAVTGAALMPLAETMAVAGVRSHGVDYGRVRLWGSVTFLAQPALRLAGRSARHRA